MHSLVWTVALIFLLAQVPVPAVQAAGAPGTLPPPAQKKIDFTQDIKPLLESSCIKCHAHGQKKGGFQIDSHESFLKGGETGPAVLPGKSGESYLIHLVSGFDPDKIMPQKGPRLTANQIALLRAWIDQGLVWGENVVFRRARQADLAPRRPPVPGGKNSPSANPIDLFLQAYFKTNQVKPPALVDDRRFARRVFFDVIGLPPSPGELEEFVTDRDPRKRERLVRRLLGRQEDYAEHWLSFWNDALRNDYRGTGYIDGGRKQITAWLYPALATNMPFKEFVAELVNPTPASEGFAKGIVWRGAVNASQTPQMQAAQNISQVFLGINLKCASCHDSFINDWKLADSYGLASVYADEALEMVRCENPTGKKASIKFLFPELGQIDPRASHAERLARLAEIITDSRDGRLARTIVNRIWAKFLGRGLVEPVDEMDNLPWDQDLLDWLATDLADHGYDLKRTMELILTSRAYQYPAVNLKELDQDHYIFAGPAVRRLSAEQFLDALSSVTGIWHDAPAADIDFSLGKDLGPATGPPGRGARWIWNDAKASESAPAGPVYFRKQIVLEGTPEDAVVVATADNSFTLYVNGREALKGDNFQNPRLASLAPYLHAGTNSLAVAAVNGDPAKTNQPAGPAGFWLSARIGLKPSRSGAADKARTKPPPPIDLVTDRSWRVAARDVTGWQNQNFPDQTWEAAVELGDARSGPWNLEKPLSLALQKTAHFRRTRASLVPADSLMVALGRPNREQVITTRPSVATTLQALELTNGSTLAEYLKNAAQKILGEGAVNPRDLIDRLYLQGLGRKPRPDESNAAVQLVGSPPQTAGLQDFLWALAMLPDFQLIY